MELVKGLPITKYCDEQHLTPKQRLELFIPVCQAVQHAHQKGIIHRDLKPSNVLVARYDGQPVPKVIDFGVAKATSQKLTEKTMFTEIGQVIGTLEYMSPEQAEVNQLDIDTRSDIYSLGVLLYELLTGVTPFDRKRLQSAAFDEMLRIIREEEPPRASMRLSTIETLPSVAANRRVEPVRLRTLLRGELDWIVMKSMEKDRARRYETANNLAADIQRYLVDEPVEACPPSASYRFQKFARRNKAALATACMVALALFAGLLGTAWQAWRATTAEHTATEQRDLAIEAERSEREQANKANDAAAAARRESVRAKAAEQTAIAEKERATEQLQITTVTRLAAESRVLQDERPALGVLLAVEAVELSKSHGNVALPIAHEALLNSTQKMRRGRSLTGHEQDVSMLMSADWLVTKSDDKTQLWSLRDKDPASSSIELPGENDSITHPEGQSLALSEDGRWLVTGGSKLRRWDLTARNPALSPLVLAENVDIRALDLSSDGRWLVAQGKDGRIHLRDLSAPDPTVARILVPQTATGNEHLLPTFQWKLKISPDGRWVAQSFKGTVELWDLHDEDESASPLLLTGHTDRVDMVISRDGRWLVTARVDNNIRLWDLKADNPSASPQDIKAPPFSQPRYLTITPDSRWLFAAGRNANRVYRWDLSAAEPADSLLPLRGHQDGVTTLAISQDGRWLVSAGFDGSARLWSLDAADPSSATLVLRGHDRGWVFPNLAIHPRGHWIATSRGGTVRLWDLGAAEPTSSPFVLGGHEDDIFSASAISSDGRLIATSISDNSIRLWDIEATDPSSFSRVLQRHEDRIASMTISPNDRWLVTGSMDNTARLWDLTKQDVASSLVVLSTEVVDPSTMNTRTGELAIDPTNRWLAMAGADHNVQLWDLSANDPASSQRVLSGHESPVISLVISPDGRWLVTGAKENADHTARVWDLRTADPQASSRVLKGHVHRIYSMAIDGDSRWLAIPNSSDVWLWDLKSEDPVATSPRVIPWSADFNTWQVAMSPDAHWLFAAHMDYTTQLWDLNRNDAPPYEQRNRGSQSVAISPDGRWLATTNRMNVQLWDLTASNPMDTVRFLRGHKESIWKLRISADSRWLLSDASDGTIRRWSLDLEWLLDYARTVAGRELTDEERRRYQIERLDVASKDVATR